MKKSPKAIIKIELDKPVSINDSLPDIEYCVKKTGFDGVDFFEIQVPCDVELSDDHKTIQLYPQVLLNKESFNAYKIELVAKISRVSPTGENA